MRSVMGDFDDHLAAGKKYAVFLAVASAAVMLYMGFSTNAIVLTALLAGTYGLLGSLLSDIDHQDSKPRQIAGKYVTGAIIFGIIALPVAAPDFIDGLGRLVAAIGFSAPHDVLGSGLVVVTGVAAIVFGGGAFDSSTTHRGFTHSAAFAFLTGVVAYGTFVGLGSVFSELRFLPREAGAIIALAAAGGVFVHLYVDDII